MAESLPWRGVAAVLGGFLLQFTMGAFYSFGNMSTYMTSYMRQHGSPDITYTGRTSETNRGKYGVILRGLEAALNTTDPHHRLAEP